MCNSVAEKYNEVQAIEKSVIELNQMFQDMAYITEMQGELLDQIETQVKEATEYVEEGNVQMRKATDLLINTRKWQCIICTILLVILSIIIGVAVAFSKKNNNNNNGSR